MSLSKKHTQKKDLKKCKGLFKKTSQNKPKKSNKKFRKETSATKIFNIEKIFELFQKINGEEISID